MPIEMLQQPAIAVGCAFLFGLLIGSFLNVVILRLPARLEWQWRRESREVLELPEPDVAATAPAGLMVDRSRCPHCGHQLAAWDNIPLLSFLVLRGRCRHCRAPISWQYPAVELLTGIAFAVCVWHFGPNAQALLAMVFSAYLIALSGIDLQTTLLPDQLTYPLLWLGLLLSTIGMFVDPVPALLGAAAGYMSLWSVYWLAKLIFRKEGFGYGDFKLLAALGAWCGIKAILPIVLMSSLVGALVGSGWWIFKVMKGGDRSTEIPFGQFLAIAGWTQFISGADLFSLFLRWTSFV